MTKENMSYDLKSKRTNPDDKRQQIHAILVSAKSTIHSNKCFCECSTRIIRTSKRTRQPYMKR